MATYQITINEKTSEGKNLLVFLQGLPKYVKFEQKEQKENLSDPTEMTKEKFYAQIREAEEQIASGQYTVLKTKKDIRNFMRNL